MKVSVEKSTLVDVLCLKDSLREEDTREIWDSFHHTPEQSLLIGYTFSELCYTIKIGYMPVAMFGYVPDKPNTGHVWCLGSNQINQIPKAYVRITKEYITKFLDECPYLYNHVDDRYKKSIKWLQILGAKMHDPEPFGAEQKPFRYFYFEKEK